ncbi:respiratory nitrate reductase subunit gamma [Myxococcus sp. K15C18031901]|uniref:respiratory nitrate reductase subunit gamma n=1 Tax=Myxococcus dinghuensis TaxID=2906761 RepID=UPI0020A6EFC4|nr:respiratory nitrate reductase subunit gamma [Myxococcus dinghuensis]MCP3098936.1 respiratory nitrate reductase subunit gamma [Myxococcus dinghuensis]
MSDSLLFTLVPYAAAGIAAAGLVHRFVTRAPPPTKARASQDWTPAGRAVLGGTAIVALNHLLGLAAPRAMQLFNGSPSRLFALESLSLVGALLLGWGLASLTLRRAREGQWGSATALGLVFAQVLSGVYVAVTLRWGSAWYVHVAVPYLRSLMAFQPEATLMLRSPLAFQLHVLGGFALLAVAPFFRTRPVAAVVQPRESVEPGMLATPREETP